MKNAKIKNRQKRSMLGVTVMLFLLMTLIAECSLDAEKIQPEA